VPKLKALARDGHGFAKMPAEEALRAITRADRDVGDEDFRPTAENRTARSSARKRGESVLDDVLLDLTLSESNRRKAAHDLGEMRVVPERRAEVAKALATALEETRDHFLRCDLLRALKTWNSPEVLPVVLDYTRSSDYFIRKAALETLTGFKNDEKAIRALAENLPEHPYEIGPLLATMGPAAEPILIEFLQHPDHRTRIQVIDVLGKIGTKPAQIALIKLARKADPATRAAAQQAVMMIRMRGADKTEKSEPSGKKSGDSENPFQEMPDDSSPFKEVPEGK
jgi:HEAT repeat protein